MNIPPRPLPSPTVYLSHAAIPADGKTDAAKALQVLFDRAEDGRPIEIVNDLPMPVMTSGNDVWPNTIVRTLAGGGWRLVPGSTHGILRNKHPIASWPRGAHQQDGRISAGPTPPQDANIQIIGGLFDGNRRSGGWPNDGRTPNNAHPVLGRDDLMVEVLQFYGVRHLVLRDVHVYDSPSLAIHIGNVIDVTAEDCQIECPSVIYASNTDGFHVNGPAQNISISNLKVEKSGDDAVALNADDSMESTTEGNQATYFGMSAGWGPITHVRIHGLYLDRCTSGLRTLSATQRIDDVIVSDMQGTCLVGPLLLNKYLFNHDTGNIGAMTFDNVQVSTLGSTYDGQAAGFIAPKYPAGEVVLCNEKIESLVLRNVSDVATTGAPWAGFSGCEIGLLSVDGFNFNDSRPNRNGTSLFRFDQSTIVHSALLTGINWLATGNGNAGVLHNDGRLDRVSIDNVLLPPGTVPVMGNPPKQPGR